VHDFLIKVVTKLQLMFPDSQIAANFSLDSNECSHIVGFGLGPYFHGETVRSLKSSKGYFCLELDETSTCSGDKQLNTHLRFWDEVPDMVVVHYYNISPWSC
jgi:quinolinate synthase